MPVMLIRRDVLDRIKAGEITLQFRRWKKPSVKTGGTLKTAVGVLAIHEVKAIHENRITKADAKAAGFATRNELIDALGERDGEVYRIAVSYAGADPRVELRENDDLSDDEFEAIREKLERFDKSSTHGAWTQPTLAVINKRPHVLAVELADELGFEKDWFKTHVRKLKNLGLTISKRYSRGYELSPRGKEVLRRLQHPTSGGVYPHRLRERKARRG